MSIETTEETFAALTEGLDRELACEPCEDDGVLHASNWFYTMACDHCDFEMDVTVCDMVHYGLVARKETARMTCARCDVAVKTFDFIKTTRKVS